MNEILKLTNLTKHFGGIKAVDDVSFQLYEGEILGLLGPNGAGKTTCFNMISGVFKPTRGTIEFLGQHTEGQPPHKMAALGVGRTFQIVKPFANLSVLENVIAALGLKFYQGRFLSMWSTWDKKEFSEKAMEYLDVVGLSDRASQRAGLMPIGNLRKLEIARALALNPKLLLLDESFSGLRNEEIKQIEDLVLSIRDRGISILLIEHNMKVAMKLSDRIVVLDHGRKLAEGKPEEIIHNPLVIEAYLGKGGSANAA